MAPKKRPSAAAVARATFDPHPPPLTDDATTSPRRERPLIEQARPPPAQVRVQSAQEVADRVGVTTVTLWKWSKCGKFPPPRRIGTRNIGWLSTDVDEWIANLPRVRQ